jgi:hypothetical protein
MPSVTPLRRLRRARHWAPAAACMTAVLGLCGVAYARECERTVPAADGTPPSVLIIMDASASMAKPAGGGQTRLQAAKAALRTLVDGLPDGARVGLRLYGHSVSGAGRAAGCRDTELVAPVGRLDRARLTAQIDAYEAVGSTPIGRALRASANDLPDDGTTSIVLVSDGGDNCAPPSPCAVAEQIAAEGTRVSIQAIGFQVTPQARSALRCIASRGRGVYRDAGDAEQLAVALRALAARATRTYEPQGTAIAGGTTARTARAIGGGRYVDRIAVDGDRWYAVELGAGQRLATAAILVPGCLPPRGFGDLIGTSLVLEVYPPGDPAAATRSGVANLFFNDSSVESDGLLTARVDPRTDATRGSMKPVRHLVHVRLNDSGNGSLATVLHGSMPMQLELNILGRPPPAGPAGTRGGEGDGATLLVTIVLAGLLGAGTALVAASRKRGSR